MTILVTGCARSGTRYMAKGMGLGHERWTPRGMSSWLCAAMRCDGFELPPPKYHDPIPADWQPDEVIHVVRHPLNTIASLLTVQPAWWAWAQTYVDVGYEGEVSLPVAMRYWLRWNAQAENLVGDTAYWNGGVTRLEEQDFPGVSKATNAREHGDVGWDDLRAADEKLYVGVMVRAASYGYGVEVPCR